MCQPYIESATVLSEICIYISRKVLIEHPSVGIASLAQLMMFLVHFIFCLLPIYHVLFYGPVEKQKKNQFGELKVYSDNCKDIDVFSLNPLPTVIKMTKSDHIVSMIFNTILLTE